MSFASPIPPARTAPGLLAPLSQVAEPLVSTPEVAAPDDPDLTSDTHEDSQEFEEDIDDEGEKTIVLRINPPVHISEPALPPATPKNESESPGRTPASAAPTDTPSDRKRFKVKVNSEVERIVVSCVLHTYRGLSRFLS